MFKNIEKTLKIMAMVCFWIALIFGVITLFIGFSYDEGYVIDMGAVLIASAFVGMLPIYGLGELIAQVKMINNRNSKED